MASSAPMARALRSPSSANRSPREMATTVTPAVRSLRARAYSRATSSSGLSIWMMSSGQMLLLLLSVPVCAATNLTVFIRTPIFICRSPLDHLADYFNEVLTFHVFEPQRPDAVFQHHDAVRAGG